MRRNYLAWRVAALLVWPLLSGADTAAQHARTQNSTETNHHAADRATRPGAREITLNSLTLVPAQPAGSCPAFNGKVRLNGRAPAAGIVVALSNTNPAASVPATVTIPAGAFQQSFTITTTAMTTKKRGTVTASHGAVRLSKPLLLRPVGIKSLSLEQTALAGGQTVTGVVALECGNASGPVVVKLSSSNAVVAKPLAGSLTIPAGETRMTFTVNTARVSRVSHTYIRATVNGISKNMKLTINP